VIVKALVSSTCTHRRRHEDATDLRSDRKDRFSEHRYCLRLFGGTLGSEDAGHNNSTSLINSALYLHSCILIDRSI